MRADRDDTVERLGLLASAISSRALRVAPGENGAPAWTDGSVIFVDPGASAREQVRALAVQASLLAAGSLDRDVVSRLRRRPALARRYLAAEGHRALGSLEDLLPPSARSLIDPDAAARSDSPGASLDAALRREAIDDPPPDFGAIRVGRLLASMHRSEAAASSSTDRRAPAEPGRPTTGELAEDEDGDRGRAEDLFSSRVGGRGPLGRWLGRMLEAVRRLQGGGPPGTDAPSHHAREGATPGASAASSTRTAAALEEGDAAARGVKYPEWDVHRRRYRRDWCTVQEVEPGLATDAALAFPDGRVLRRPLARLGMGLDRTHRQAQGDDIDIDAAIEARVDVMAGSAVDEAFYVDSLRRRRDLAVLLLLDVSGSSAEPAALGATVHEEQRTAAGALLVALHDLGDRVALYAFRSQGRSAVHLLPVKRFDESPDTRVMRRLWSLAPGAYSRLGAAIRHGQAVLRERGGTARPLLVVLSDGLAYDHGYEPAYGAADARRALSEARRAGVGCLCLSVGASTDAEALRRVFGSAAHATIPEPARLGRVIGPLFRSALRSAELRPRLAS